MQQTISSASKVTHYKHLWGDISKIVLDAPGGYQTGQCWHSRVHASRAHSDGDHGIERSNRQALARSLIFSDLLSGAGTWPQLTAASARRIRAVFMRVQRMLLVNFRSTAAATCESEVLRELGASSLAIELRKARLMNVPHHVCVEQTLLAAVLQSSPEDPWVNALRADLEDMKARSGGKLSGVPPFFTRPAAVVQSLEVLSRSVEGTRGHGVQRGR